MKFLAQSHLHIAAREYWNLTCKMFIGCAVINFGGAEPIRVDASCTVFKIFVIKRGRRENLRFFGRSFAVIGRKGDQSSGFLS